MLMQFSPVAHQFRRFFNYIFCRVRGPRLWATDSLVNTLWLRGNLTHMFSCHRVFVSCQRHVCSLGVNVTLSVWMSVSSTAGENLLRRNEKLTVYFVCLGFFFYCWEYLGTTSEESLRPGIADAAGIVLHSLQIISCLWCRYTFARFYFSSETVSSQPALKLERNICDKQTSNRKTISLFEAELCRPRCGELRPIPQATYWLKSLNYPCWCSEWKWDIF